MSSHRVGGLRAAALSICLVIGSCVLTIGCASKAPIQNVTLSYNTLKNILLQAFPTGLKEQSSNGRTLRFNYFDPVNWSKPAETANERAYAVVIINGSSRPYNIEAYMVRETKGKNGAYTSSGRDPELSAKLVKEIKGLLANRREDRNIIDEFRAF